MKFLYHSWPEYKNHEKIIPLSDKTSGLKGFIVVHNTNLGSALGGTRIYPYKSMSLALKDALLLSRAMTYKCAIAGMPFGGGKGVIIANPKQKNIKKILQAYAKEVEKLKGLFRTGEDVGMTGDYVEYMSRFSKYFIGQEHLAGDPSPYAAHSAFLSLKIALKQVYKNSSIKGRTFAIKGLGKTGSCLAEYLIKEGGFLWVSDIDMEKSRNFEKKYGQQNVRISSPEKICMAPADVYVPCAMGNDINENLAKKIKFKIVVGTANNQLSGKDTAKILQERGILHIPDYVSNAGGVINVANELLPGGYKKSRVLYKINKMKNVLEKILQISKKQNKSPDLVADRLAEDIFLNKNKVFTHG